MGLARLEASPLVPSLCSTVDHLFVPTCRYPEPSCRTAVKDGRRADLNTRSPLAGHALTGASTAAGSRLNGTAGDASMRDNDLMQLGRGLIPPWMGKDCAFDADKRRLDIEIEFRHGRPPHVIRLMTIILWHFDAG